MNDQRKVIFEQRVEWMSDEVTAEIVADMRHDVIEALVHKHVPENAYPEQWDVAGLKEELTRVLSLDLPVDEWAKEEGIADEELLARINRRADEHMAGKVAQWGPDVLRYVEKSILLQTLDHLWREHLVMLEHLRQVIGLRGYGQRDPLNEYKAEAFNLFETMSQSLREGVTAQLMRVEIVQQEPDNSVPKLPPMQASHVDPSTGEDELALAAGRRADAGARRHHAEARRRAQPERSVDLGQGRPQRRVPVWLRQEVQALPRAVRVTAQTNAKTKSPGECPAMFVSDPMIVQRKPDQRLSKVPVGTTGAAPFIAVLAGAAAAGVTAPGAGACASVVLIGCASACLARIAPFEARLVGFGGGLRLRGPARAWRLRRRRVLACPDRPGAPCDRGCLRSFGSAGLASAVFDENRLPNRPPPLDRAADGMAGLVSAMAIAGGVTSPEMAGVGAMPATTGASASSGMRGGRTVAGIVPGGVLANRLASCGATPIWFFFTASTNTGCMPPSAIGLDRRGRDIAAAQVGELKIVLCAPCSEPGWRSLPALHRPGTCALALNDKRATGRRLGVEHVVLVADVDLGLELADLEMVVALLQHLPERQMFGLLRCLARCSAPSSGTDRPAPGTISGRRRRRRGRARRFPQICSSVIE